MGNLDSGNRDPETDPIRFFYSYSHKDKVVRENLAGALSTYEEKGLIRSWIDRYILAGSAWTTEIRENLEASDVIVLMISANFIESEWCIKEMQYALERQKTGDAHVLPLMVGEVDWNSSGIEDLPAKFQMLPKGRPPISEWKSRQKQQAWIEVAEEIGKVVNKLGKERQQGTKALAYIKPKKFEKDSLQVEDLRDAGRALYSMIQKRGNFDPDLLIAFNQGGMITAAVMNKEWGKPVGAVHSVVRGHRRVVKHISLPYKLGAARRNGGKQKIAPSNILVVDTKLKTAESALAVNQLLLDEYGPNLDIRYAIVLSYGGWKPSSWQVAPSHRFDWPIRFRPKNLQAYVAYYTDCEPMPDPIVEEYRPGSEWSR